MAPDAKLESMSYNPFTVNDNCFNSESDPDINFYSDILLLTQNISIQTKFVKVLNVLHVNIRSINKIFYTFKNFYSKLNCTFSVICFSETWATNNSIFNYSNFR